MTESFVYCWTDHLTNKLYVGCHKGACDDGYICSSKIMKQEYKKRPLDFSRQIIAEGQYKDILKLEEKILKSVDAAHNLDFYNLHNGDGKFFNKGLSEETKRKIGEANKISKKGCIPWNKGKQGYQTVPASEERKLKIALSKIGKKRPGVGGVKKGHKFPNRKRPILCSDEHRHNLSIATTNYWKKKKEI